MRPVYLALGTCLLTVATTPVAADQPAATVEKAKAAKPVQRVTCEKIEQIGSRIATQTFCGTAEQWAQRRAEDRQWVDKLQASPCVFRTNDANGMPQC